jgi:hypothetical protein
MPPLNTDAILWYNVGEFGEAGYAVPNWSNDVGSLNPHILQFVSLAGANLFSIMHHADADLRVPPSVNTLKRIHKLYLRCASLLAGNAIPPGQDNMEVEHYRPGGEIFRVYPCPFFLVRNTFLRKWAELIFIMQTEAMQSTENRKEMEISTWFAGKVGQYIRRVYTNMSIELFNKDKEVAEADGFVLTPEDFNAYDPSLFFTDTELTDTVPRLDRVFTEDRLAFLREGIPVTQLPPLGPWPNNLTTYYASIREDQTIAPSGVSNASGGETSIEVESSGTQKVAIIPKPPGTM